MTVTKKFIYLLCFGLIFVVYMPLFIAFNVVCFGVLLFDFLTTPKLSSLQISRMGSDKLYYKADNDVEISVRNNYYKALKVTIKDDLPDLHFEFLKGSLTHTIAPSEQAIYKYSLLPKKRGSFLFCNVNVKILSGFGLCERFSIYKKSIDMKVYPNLKDLSKYRLIMQKNRLLEMGDKRIFLKGNGTEFESMREYVEGDDYRKINWNSSARENKLIVNQYEAEKNQPVVIMLDTGRPMSYSINGYKKLDTAINAALILSDIINQKGDNSGLVVFDTQVNSYVLPGKGEAHRNLLMETLYHIEDTKHTSDYSAAFQAVISKQKRRSIVFIFTDFETLGEAKMLTRNIDNLRRRHIPIVVLMKNESVIKLASDKQKDLKTIYTKSVALDFLQERKNIVKSLSAKGVFCVETTSENFALSAVNYYLSVKNRNVV